MEIVAHAYNGYTDKFGIPRQSGRVEAVETRIVFTAPFRSPDAIRGIEQWSHLWLIWSPTGRDERIASSPYPTMNVETPLAASLTPNNEQQHSRVETPFMRVSSLTVRPPRLGGNVRLGVFATRSPFRPNGLCLSSVKLLRVEQTENEGHVLIVSGADLMNGTPIYDIKPYLPYTDSHPEATNGFAEEHKNDALQVVWSPEAENMLAALCHDDNYQLSIIHYQLTQVLAEDPRPGYHASRKSTVQPSAGGLSPGGETGEGLTNRVYGLTFGGYNVHFQVEDNILKVLDITCIDTD